MTSTGRGAPSPARASMSRGRFLCGRLALTVSRTRRSPGPRASPRAPSGGGTALAPWPEPLGPDGEQDAAVAEAEVFAQLALRRGHRARAVAEAVGHDVDLVRGHAEVRDEIVRRRLRDRDDPPRPPRRAADERAHAERVDA